MVKKTIKKNTRKRVVMAKIMRKRTWGLRNQRYFYGIDNRLKHARHKCENRPNVIEYGLTHDPSMRMTVTTEPFSVKKCS